MRLADEYHVRVDYNVGELDSLHYQEEQFDAIALIYAHFPASIKSSLHNKLSAKLRKGGIIIFEAFSKNHLEYRNKNEKVGGPRELDMLFSIEEIQHDFPNFEILILEEKVIELHEGDFHNGEGSVIRFVGKRLD